jgi:hypothetical protein
VTVTCRVHGPMKHRFDLKQWECVGFDGEGCDAAAVPDEYHADVVSIPDAEVKRLAGHWRGLAGKGAELHLGKGARA